ncbi:MAG: gliding motility-associated C-terminal domain-containing protein [Bacteroidales bacterium]|nr:gliding motility-associated C-terminal domain-containing protein [Bacteroidales bacterium]
MTINVNPIPTKPIGETDKASICKYATGTEDVVAKVNNVESGYKYTWYDAADNKIAEGNEVTIPVKNDGANQSFYVIATDENFVTNCNSPKTTFTINVVELPDAPVISGQNEYCLNDASHATTLKVDNEDPSLTYKWFVGDVLVGEGVTFTTPVHLDATTVYYAKAYNATGCESLASNDQTISIVNNPVLSSLDASEIQVCPGMPSTRTIEVFSANGDNVFFKWTLDGSVVLETTVEGTSSKYTFESTEQTGTFNLKVEAWTSYKSCPAEPLNFKLTIKDFEDLQFKVNGIDYTEGKVYDLCQGTTANIVFSNLGGVSYKIVDKNNVEVFNTSESSVSMTVTDDNDYTIIKYTGDCVSPIEQHFSIAVKKQVLFDLSAPQSACLGTELVLEAVNIDFQGNDETKVDYQWFLNGTAIAGANGTTFTIDEVTAAHGGVYALTVTTEFDCTTTHEVTLDVHTIPAIVWDEEVSTNILCLDGGEKYLGIKPADGNEAPLANTLWDINTLDFGVVNTNEKITVKATSPTQYDGQILTVRAYAVDANGCQSVGISRDLTVVASPVITSVTDAEGHIDEFHLCAGNDLTLTVNSTPATGDYVYFYSKDGVDLDWNSPVMNFTSITSDMAGTYTVEILDNASGCTSSVYTFTIDFPVPSAEMQILPASKLVIAGSEVKATVTAGHDHYVFFVNGVEQTEGVFGNELIFYPKETSTVSVNVYNEYGCYITLNDEVEVLEGILKKNVIATPESYCSTERATGSVISVEDPQEGVTYTLTRVDDGVQIGEPITAVYGQPVEWTTIQTILETTLDDVEYSNTFEITARHEELPGIVETMANRVVVTEVYGYTPELITPSGTSVNCGGTFKIENAVVGFKYVIYHDGEVFGEVEKADSKTIEFTQLLQFTGKYVVKRFYSRNNVCGEYTLDTYEIAEPDLTKVIISADNKDYGYYCKQDGKNGVDLSIQATTADQEYTLFYQKTLADVAEPVTVLADGVTELKIVGNGLDLIIGNTADIKGDGFYSLGYMQNDCIQLTSKNIMEVVGYSAPAKDDFVVSSSSDVTSYFCEGTTFPVSVADKNGDKIAKYLEFHLVQEKPVYDDTFPVLEGIDTDTEAFQIANGGTYHIEVVNTNLQKLGLTCANTVLDKFTLVRLDKPAPIKAEFANDDFCLDSEGNAQDILTLRLLAPDVYYTVYDKNGIAKDVANNELVFTDAHGTGTKSFMMPLTAGKNTFTVKAQRKAGTVECEVVEVASAVVNVRPRPEVGTAVVTWNTDRKDAGIECAGVDIVVKGTTEGMLYTLYVDGDTEPFIDGGYEENSPKSSALSDGNDITFYNIGVNAKFFVTVNYPDAVLTCAEKVGDVDITANEITYVQPSLTNPNVCQGESFTQVQIKGVSQSDLDNYVYKVVTVKTDSEGNLTEKLLSSTLNASDYVIEGDYLVFSKRYTSNAKLDIKVTKKAVDGEGVVTESCPVQLGHIEFKVNKLPKSFELTGRNIYCGGKSDIQLVLPTSETGVEYVLYVYDGDDLVEYEYEDANGVSHRVAVDGEDGMSVEFPKFSTTDPRFLDKGKYTVIAINKITGCTSAMMNEVEVVNQPSIIVKDVVNGDYESCSNDATFVEIEAKDTQKDVTYYFYHTEDAAEIHRLETGITEDMLAAIVEDQDNADGLIIRKYTGKNITCLPRISGNYVVLASYDMYACPVFLDKFSYTSYRLDKYVFTASAQCGSEIKYTLGGTQEDVTYQIVSTSGKNIGDPFIGNGSEYSINIDNEITDPNEEVFVIASIGTCQEEMAGRFKPATLVMEEPTGTFDFFVEGSKWDRTNLAMPEICSSSNVTMVGKIDQKGITKYDFEYSKLVEQVDTITGLTVQVPEVYTHSDSETNVMIQNFEGFDQSQAYRVVLSVFMNECGPFKIDSVDFRIKGSSSLSSRFMPDNDHIKNTPADTVLCSVPDHIGAMHGEYCADESGVGLFFLNAEPGNIYRLFQRVSEQIDSVTVNERVEMLDMQEVPDYSSFIPGYTAAPVDTLWFTGWGANGVGNAYGATGSIDGTRYFVSVEEKDGCVINTSDLIIYENPLPIDTVSTSSTYNEVFYALMDKDGLPNLEVKSNDYGIVDAGFVILSNPMAGVSYDLIHIDSPIEPNKLVSHIVCDERTQERGWVDFGMVKSDEDAVIDGWGSGLYEVIATSNVTGCSVSVGSIEFIDEELVAYNVYLYLKKNQSTTSAVLYPNESKYGNHRYIDWSRKVDIVWAPQMVVDTITGDQYINTQAQEYPEKSGYTINEKKANIHFEMVQAMKDTVTMHDVALTEIEYNEYVEKDPKNTFKQILTRLEKYFLYDQYRDTVDNEVVIIRDSVSTGDIFITYENGKEVSRKYINTADENTKPTNDLGAVIETYKYWRQVYDTIQVVDYSRKYGDYGFDSDYDAVETPDLDQDSKSGLFRYTKMPSFFGKVELTYRIYNDMLPTIRFSNNAQIVILCGNNNLPGTDATFLLPNAFSPNGDGLNDDFRITLPHGYENSQVILEVFNRWGTRVYKSSGIRYGIDCPYWDGTSTTSNMVTVGDKLPSGTYYYVLTISVNNPSTGENEDLDLKGFVELRR